MSITAQLYSINKQEFAAIQSGEMDSGEVVMGALATGLESLGVDFGALVEKFDGVVDPITGQSIDLSEQKAPSTTSRPSVDLGKDWNALEAVLSGDRYEMLNDDAIGEIDADDEFLEHPPYKPSENALDDVIGAGHPVGEDMGYGPALLLDTERVAAISTSLDQVEPDQFRNLIDWAKLKSNEIYSVDWAESDEEFSESLTETFTELWLFYKGAASRGHAVLFCMI